MNSITRDHLFSNRLNLVEKGRKYFYLSGVKMTCPTKIKITEKGINAFFCNDWKFFERKEAEFFGGTID